MKTEKYTEEELQIFKTELSEKNVYELSRMLAAGYRGDKYRLLMQRFIEAKKQQKR